MNNIILCDFKRTQRHNRMNEINKIFNDTMQTIWLEGQCDISNEELYKLEKEYNILLTEENFWGGCKYWK